MNPTVLFIIVVGVLLICFFAGRRAGLVRSLIPVASAIASFCLLAIALQVLKEDVVDHLSGFQIKDAISSVIAFVISFLVLRWLIRTVLKFFRIIRDTPVIGSVDRALGGLAGFIGGLVIIWGTFFFLLLFFGPEGLPEFFDAVNKNEFVKLLYNNNLLMTLINYFIFAT